MGVGVSEIFLADVDLLAITITLAWSTHAITLTEREGHVGRLWWWWLEGWAIGILVKRAVLVSAERVVLSKLVVEDDLRGRAALVELLVEDLGDLFGDLLVPTEGFRRQSNLLDEVTDLDPAEVHELVDLVGAGWADVFLETELANGAAAHDFAEIRIHVGQMNAIKGQYFVPSLNNNNDSRLLLNEIGSIGGDGWWLWEHARGVQGQHVDCNTMRTSLVQTGKTACLLVSLGATKIVEWILTIEVGQEIDVMSLELSWEQETGDLASIFEGVVAECESVDDPVHHQVLVLWRGRAQSFLGVLVTWAQLPCVPFRGKGDDGPSNKE